MRSPNTASTSASAIPRASSDQQVVEEIGRLGDDAVAILGDRRDRRLHRLLAQLLGAVGDAAIDELAGIGDVGTRLRRSSRAQAERQVNVLYDGLHTTSSQAAEWIGSGLSRQVAEITDPLSFPHARARPRFLVRILHLFPPACSDAVCSPDAGVRGALASLLLSPIFKAQGWDHSPFNLYPPRAATCGATWSGCAPTSACRSAARSVSAIEPRCRAGRAGGPRAGVGRGLLPRGLSRRVRRRPPDRRPGDDRRDPDVPRCRPRAPCWRRHGRTRRRPRLRRQIAEAERLGVFGAPSFTTADGELFWRNDRLERALVWAKRGS